MLDGTKKVLEELGFETALKQERPSTSLYVGTVKAFDSTKQRADVEAGGILIKNAVANGVAVDDKVMILVGHDMAVVTGGGGEYLSLTGGTMSGGIDMGGSNIGAVSVLYGAPSITMAPGKGGSASLANDKGIAQISVTPAGDVVIRSAGGHEKLKFDERQQKFLFTAPIGPIVVSEVTGQSGTPFTLRAGVGQPIRVMQNYANSNARMEILTDGTIQFLTHGGSISATVTSGGQWRFAQKPLGI